MAKYSVGIGIAKKLLHSKHREIFKFTHHLSYHRYNNNTTYSSIFAYLEKYNNFPEKHQIPIAIDKHGKCIEIDKYDTISHKSSLILFDKQNVTILNAENIMEMNEHYTFNYNKHSLLILHYFDVQNQEMIIVKYLLIDDSVTVAKLEQYILTILINDIDEMKQLYNQQKLSIYPFTKTYNQLHKNEKIVENKLFNSKKIISLVFQINSNSIRHCKAVNDSKYEYEACKLQKFCYDAVSCLTMSFNRKRIIINIRSQQWLTKFKNQINHYLTTCQSVSEKEANQLIHKIDKRLADSTNPYMIFLDGDLSVNVLKLHLSKEFFNGLISANNIELYEVAKTGLPLTTFDNTDTTWIFIEFVSYDTFKLKCDKEIFVIDLFDESQAPFPFNHNNICIKPNARIRIRMNKHCTVNEIVNKLINVSSNPLFAYKFEAMKKSFDHYINSTHPNCYLITNKFRASEKILYESIETIKSIMCWELFMIPFEVDNTTKTYRLMVRFSWENCFEINDFKKECLIGLPLFVWIDVNDTIQNILDNNTILKQYKNDIVSVYNMSEGITVSVSKHKRNTYKLYHNILCKDSNGFIVITLNQRNDLCVDQYSQMDRHRFWPFGIVLAPTMNSTDQ
eukprot:418066_1